MARALLSYVTGNWDASASDFQAAVRTAENSPDPAASFVLTAQLLPGYGLLPGNLELFENVCTRAGRIVPPGPNPLRTVVDAQRTYLAFYKGQFRQAAELGSQALAMSRRIDRVTTNEGDVAAALAMLAMLRQEFGEAESLLDELAEYTRVVGAEQRVLAAMLFHRGKLLWSQGRLREAYLLYRDMQAAEGPQELPVGPPCRAMMEGLLAEAERNYAKAIESFEEARRMSEAVPATCFFGEPTLFLAGALRASGQRNEALAAIRDAMRTAHERRTPGLLAVNGPSVVPLLQEAAEADIYPGMANHLLAEIGTRNLPGGDFGRQLTEREADILRLIAEGKSNREVAAQLFIAETTVKTHLTRAFKKLQTRSRTQAIVEARARRWI